MTMFVSYMGGKGNCYRRIIGAMPVHDTFIETHLGGGAVMRNKRSAQRQIGIDVDPQVIANWAERDEIPCELVCSDAVSFLKAFVFQGDELVYCDPPYPLATRRPSGPLYRHDYGDDDHEALLDAAMALPCRVMISGADHPLYRHRLKAWRRMEFGAGARRGGRVELLWLNFLPPDRLHDPRFRGADFRERERLKRRLASLTSRVEKLPALERAIFQEWFGARFPAGKVELAEP